MEISIKNSINFRAGLTPALRKEIAQTDCSALKNMIKDKFGTDSDLANNKVLSKLLLEAMNLCQDAGKKYNLPFNFFPPIIRVYNPQELIDSENVFFGFCIGEKFKVLKKSPEFPQRSIFIKNIKDSANVFNEQADSWYKLRITSTDSIFAPFIHELMHNFHLKILFDKYGFEKGLKKAQKMSEEMPYFDRCIVTDEIGKYASKSEIELFPETMSKIICESLDSDNKISKNPLENLNNLPEFVQNFIKNQIFG